MFTVLFNNCKQFYQKLGVTPGMLVLQEKNSNFALKYLKEMKPNKSTGLDDIIPRFLNDGAEQLSEVITYLINLSIKRKTVPDCT